MTSEVDLNSVMERLEARLDAMEKGEIPPQLREHIKEKKKDDESDDDKMAHMKMKDEEKEEKKDDDKMYMKGEDFGDVITSEYLDWMENTLKSAGVNIEDARAHFDDLAKAQLGGFDNPDSVDGADYFGGQVRGRGQESGSPSTGAISALTAGGGKQPAGAMGAPSIAKGYLNDGNVSQADIENAYEVYKAASLEQNFRNNLEATFSQRLAKELEIEKQEADRSTFDARGPLEEVLKSIGNLSERIDNLSTESHTIAKSASSANVEVPSTHDLGNMSWDEVHSLASKTLRGA